ncbi:MAG: FkbM family methyltransferase [Rhodospirillales bacterium]
MNFREFYEFAHQVGIPKWLYRYGLWQFRKRVLKTDSWLTLPTGNRVYLPRTSGSAAEVFVTNADIDWGSEALFASCAQPEDDFLDVGAHVGYYATYVSPLVHRVFAFEPDIRNHPALKTNAEHSSNIIVQEKAVGLKTGPIRLDVSGNSAVSHVTTHQGAGTTPVDAISIDDFTRGLTESNIKLIKIDVEGNDLNVVQGGLDSIQAHQPLILTEFAASDINRPRDLFQTTHKIFYRVFAFARNARNENNLVELSEADIGHVRAKMLFLVPQRLVSKFTDAVQ